MSPSSTRSPLVPSLLVGGRADHQLAHQARVPDGELQGMLAAQANAKGVGVASISSYRRRARRVSATSMEK